MVPFAEIAMAHTFYTEIHLHLTWHTKDSRPCLTPEIEPIAWDALRRPREVSPVALAVVEHAEGRMLQTLFGTTSSTHLAHLGLAG